MDIVGQGAKEILNPPVTSVDLCDDADSDEFLESAKNTVVECDRNAISIWMPLRN